MNLLKNINPFSRSRSQGNGHGAPILSQEEFRAILRHECARCDRNSHEFSLVTLDTAGHTTRDTKHLIREVIRVIRATDEIGWLGICQMGIFLPETAVEGAMAFVEKLPDEFSARIYSYPSNFPFEGGKKNGGNDKGDVNPCIHHSEAVDGIPGLIYPARLPGWKRASDIAGSLAGLIMLTPLFLAVGAFIKLVSPGPVFFKQDRVGYLGSPFTMWKFRTLQINADTSVHETHLNSLLTRDETLTNLDLVKYNRLITLAALSALADEDKLDAKVVTQAIGDLKIHPEKPNPMRS